MLSPPFVISVPRQLTSPGPNAMASRRRRLCAREEAVTIDTSRVRSALRRLLTIFNVESGDYLKFMDFLRHQHLKPH